MISITSLSIAIIIIILSSVIIVIPLIVYAVKDEICHKVTLYSLTSPPQKEPPVVLCHPVGKRLTAANNAAIEFNLGVEDAQNQKNTNQMKCPIGHTKDWCQGWDYQMRWK